MAKLQECLTRMLALPEREMPSWLLTAKRAGRSVDMLFAELRGATMRQTAKHTSVVPVPVLSIDEQNRRTLAALSNRIAAEARRDSLRRRMYPTPAEVEQDRRSKQSRELCAKIKALGESLLEE